MSYGECKLDACFMARVYDARSGTLAGNILSYATKGWVRRKEDLYQDEREEHPLDQDKEGYNARQISQDVEQSAMEKLDTGE